MAKKSPLVALCSSVAFAAADGAAAGDVPEWVHLLPAGELLRTNDGRGPYRVVSLQAVADASLKPGQKLPIDECHSIDRAAPMGLPAPARGWIVELQARDDGLWGRVDWTPEGEQLMAGRAYSGLSPAILHTGDKRVVQVLRASLINTPNLTGLVALHSEEPGMDWRTLLLQLLGLDSEADDAAIETALKAKMTTPAMQSVVQHPDFVALQSQFTAQAGELQTLREGVQRKDAETYIDGQIAAGRVGLKPVRDTYIALHMENAERARSLIEAMPTIGSGSVAGDVVPSGGTAAPAAEDTLIMSAFGVSEEDWKAGLKKAGLSKEAL